MIDMCMRRYYGADGKTVPLQHRENALGFVTRIDDDRIFTRLVAYDDAVALQRPDGEVLYDQDVVTFLVEPVAALPSVRLWCGLKVRTLQIPSKQVLRGCAVKALSIPTTKV
jgi:hypothetical protein